MKNDKPVKVEAAKGIPTLFKLTLSDFGRPPVFLFFKYDSNFMDVDVSTSFDNSQPTDSDKTVKNPRKIVVEKYDKDFFYLSVLSSNQDLKFEINAMSKGGEASTAP